MHEAEESPLLEVVTRKRLVMMQQAGKRLSGCVGDLRIVEISDSTLIVFLSGVYKWSINPSPIHTPSIVVTPKSYLCVYLPSIFMFK
jgi:hypothetical protein